MLIKCPECGHQVSDKAPLCPQCGVEIAGKISKCHQCGEIYLSEDGKCPHCNSLKKNDIPSMTVVSAIPMDEEDIIARPIVETTEHENEFADDTGRADTNSMGKGNGNNTFIISLLIAAIICGVGLYFYKDAVDRMDANENTDIPTAKYSSETDDKNGDVPAGKSVEDDIRPSDEVAVSEEEPVHYEITPDEKEKATESIRRFLRAINSHDNDALINSVSSFLTSFNGKDNATKYDILQYMEDLYQADVKNLNWHIDSLSNIEKRENAEGQTEYAVILKATKETERDGGTSRHKFDIKATVDTDWKISAANITRE